MPGQQQQQQQRQTPERLLASLSIQISATQHKPLENLAVSEWLKAVILVFSGCSDWWYCFVPDLLSRPGR